MNSITVTVGAITYALKLRKLLSREGIQSKLVKVDNTANHSGCSHGLLIDERDFYSAVVIMKNNGIAYTVQKSNR